MIPKKALVMRSTGLWYELADSDGRRFTGRLRGKSKKGRQRATNPVAVGDFVLFEEEKDGENVIITKILPRENEIIRRSVKNPNQVHVIAANIDRAVLLITPVFPRTSFGFVDRFLISAESYRIPCLLVFNKTDLLDETGLEFLAEFREIYERIGYPTMAISALRDADFSEFQAEIRGRKNLIVGHSGVGKSTLINRLAPEIGQLTAEISDFAQKGVHTTTFAQMFEIEEDTFYIDTPGIKELGLAEMGDLRIDHLFPEMRELLSDCRFPDCRHSHEPGCAIKAAVEAGEIAPSRFASYLSMCENDDNRR